MRRPVRIGLLVLTVSVPFAAYYVQQRQAMALAAVKAANAAAGKFAGRRAVVVGGTSGIGHGVAVRLAAADMDVTIVGRDAARGGEIVKELDAAGRGRHEFVRVDASLINNAYDFGASFVAAHPSLDVLVLTPGIATLQGRTETHEGVDVKLALHYFSRMAFVDALLPALRKGTSPRVLSVLAAGAHSPYTHWRDDFELKTHYTLSAAAEAACLYNDCAAEALSLQPENAGITFVHAAPGFIATNWGTEMPSWVRTLLVPAKWFARSLYDCGEFMAAPLLQPQPPGGGWKLMGAEGQPAPPTSAHAQARDTVWAQTRALLERVRADKAGAKAAAGEQQAPLQ
jgi:NAD(P)-dependent dehydrogenase (short-subunit alcohol dehydrogenase family)